MAAEDQPEIQAAAPMAPIPETLWVRHQGGLHQLPLCPHMRPYITVALMPVTGWQPGQPVESQVISMVDDTRMTVFGAGLSAQDPMFCPEMENAPLPDCRCQDVPGDVTDTRADTGVSPGDVLR